MSSNTSTASSYWDWYKYYQQYCGSSTPSYVPQNWTPYPRKPSQTELDSKKVYSLQNIIPATRVEFDPQPMQIRVYLYDYQVAGGWMATAVQPGYEVVPINHVWDTLPDLFKTFAKSGSTFTVRGKSYSKDIAIYAKAINITLTPGENNYAVLTIDLNRNTTTEMVSMNHGQWTSEPIDAAQYLEQGYLTFQPSCPQMGCDK